MDVGHSKMMAIYSYIHTHTIYSNTLGSPKIIFKTIISATAVTKAISNNRVGASLA